MLNLMACPKLYITISYPRAGGKFNGQALSSCCAFSIIHHTIFCVKDLMHAVMLNNCSTSQCFCRAHDTSWHAPQSPVHLLFLAHAGLAVSVIDKHFLQQYSMSYVHALAPNNVCGCVWGGGGGGASGPSTAGPIGPRVRGDSWYSDTV